MPYDFADMRRKIYVFWSQLLASVVNSKNISEKISVLAGLQNSVQLRKLINANLKLLRFEPSTFASGPANRRARNDVNCNLRILS